MTRESDEVTPEVAPEPASAAPDSLAAMEAKALAYLDSIDPRSDEEAEDEKWERAAGTPKDPEPEVAEETEDEPDEETPSEAAEADETTEDEPDGEEAPSDDSNYTRAVEALRRNGWKDGDFKALSRERVLELGLKQAKRHDDYAATFAENRRLKSSQPKSEEAAAGSERTVESSAPPAGPPLKEATAKLKEALGLEGDEGDDALAQFGQALVAPLLQQLQQSQQALQMQGQVSFNTAARLARDDLLGDFPGLKEAGYFQEVLGELDKLNPDAYEGDPISKMRSAMFDAASLLERRRGGTEKPRRAPKKPSARATATPPGHRRVDDTAAKSAFEKAQSLLDQLERKHGVT